jgi:hypothetical protein
LRAMRCAGGLTGLASHAVIPSRWKSPLPDAVVTEPRRADRTRTRHERAPKSSPARSAVDVRGRARDATPTAMPGSVQSSLVRAVRPLSISGHHKCRLKWAKTRSGSSNNKTISDTIHAASVGSSLREGR